MAEQGPLAAQSGKNRLYSQYRSAALRVHAYCNVARKISTQKRVPAIFSSQSSLNDCESSSKSSSYFFWRNSGHQLESFQQVYVVSSFAISSTRPPQSFLKHVSSPLVCPPSVDAGVFRFQFFR